MKSSELAPLLFTVYLAAASGRSPALPCFAAFFSFGMFFGIIRVYTVVFSDPDKIIEIADFIKLFHVFISKSAIMQKRAAHFF